ncbi:hypothetical protein ACTQ5F_10990 [Jeotgalibaca porci]|uniref:hypothetical protein n=1 Tax=Jeotgalibaca porci TaxID=1868793 RepID=UPI003F92184B
MNRKGINGFVPVDIKQFKTRQGTWKNMGYATKEEQDFLNAHPKKLKREND